MNLQLCNESDRPPKHADRMRRDKPVLEPDDSPQTVRVGRDFPKARFIDWMNALTSDPSTDTVRLSSGPSLLPASEQRADDRQNSVATVVATLAFQELDVKHEGYLSREFLLRSYKQSCRFRDFMLPLLSLPGLTPHHHHQQQQNESRQQQLQQPGGTVADSSRRWKSMLKAMETIKRPADDREVWEEEEEDYVPLAAFVAFFEAASHHSMRPLIPRRPIPRQGVQGEADFVRKRFDPNHAEPATMWELRTARGAEPWTIRTTGSAAPGFAPRHMRLASSPSLPQIVHHSRSSPTTLPTQTVAEPRGSMRGRSMLPTVEKERSSPAASHGRISPLPSAIAHSKTSMAQSPPPPRPPSRSPRPSPPSATQHHQTQTQSGTTGRTGLKHALRR